MRGGTAMWTRRCGGESAPLGQVRIRNQPPSPTAPSTAHPALRWYDPAAGAFLETPDETADDRQRLADDNQRLADAKREADARVAELEALVEKMRRG